MQNREFSQIPKRPNIVFILMDDMGWMDLGCQGSAFYETPVLDQLAREGMRFTDAYAACPVCSPTRASLMSGKYPARVGVTDWIDHSGTYHPCYGKLVDAPYHHHLPHSETSLAQALQEGGYQTWHVGKWHLGQRAHYPETHGFEVNVGGCHWGHPAQGYFSPYGIETLPEGPEGEYLTDRLTEEAIQLIRSRNRTQPFFLNLWHYAVHTPIEAKQEDIRYFEEKARRMGLDHVESLEEGEHFPTEQKRHLRVTRRRLQSDPAYAAMIRNLDENTGRLLQTLAEEGLDRNTLVVFTSDNGGLATAEGSPTCNAPLAEGKGWMAEGGVREPLIVRWPGVVPPDSLCAIPVTSPDFYPTLLQAAQLPLRPEQHRDGVSFLPLLQGNERARGPIFWHYPHYGNQGGTPGAAIRDGEWKLVEQDETGTCRLFQLVDDIGETTDLSSAYPEKTHLLRQRLASWRQEVGAIQPRTR
jgi:arylsulfatase A-like enzyme